MNPLHEGYLRLFLPETPLSRSQALEGLFGLTRRPSRALNLALNVASVTLEIQGRRQEVHRSQVMNNRYKP